MSISITKKNLLSLREEGYFSFICAVLSCVIMPIHVDFLPPLIILWVVTWIMENYDRMDKIRQIRKSYLLLFVLIISYYLWQVIGVLYSSDFRMALLNLFGRLSLILFPVVLIIPGKTIMTRIVMLTRIFSLSVFLYLVFCFGYAFYRSINIIGGNCIFNPIPPEYKWLNYFYGADLTVSQHPSYFAIYVLISVIIALESFFNFSFKRWHRIGWLVLSIMMTLSLYFLSSRAAILVAIIIIPLYLIFKVLQLRRSVLNWFWILILIGPCVFFSLAQNGNILFSEQANNKTDRDPRIIVWKSAVKISSENLLLGVGIGDVRAELVREYYRRGEVKMAIERLNAHNQFLEILLESGLVGIFIFFSIVLTMFSIAYFDRNILYGVFIIMIVLFFLFESVLYRLAGVTFFSLFSFLLIHINYVGIKTD
jgi:O-antigen ligase